MSAEGFLIARVSGCAMTVAPDPEQEKIYQINAAMKKLYREGFRRFRTVRMVRTGDDEKFMVMGWRA